MHEPNAKFQEPFRAISRELKEELEMARLARTSSDAVVEKWPDLRERILEDVLPTFKHWVAQLRKVIQPKQLKTLQKKKRALERMSGRTWWHPAGLYLRMRILGYGMLMGMVILLLLLLGIGTVVALVYLVSLVLNRG